jgi:hypothetical protein
MQPLLQPLRTTQLLDRAVHLYRRHFLFFILLCMPGAVFVVGSGELTRRALEGASRDNSLGIFMGWITQMIAYATAFGATAAVVVFALRGFQSNQPITVLDCYRGVRPHWLRIAGIEILLAIRMALVFFLGAIAPGALVRLAMIYYPATSQAFLAWRVPIAVTVILLILASMFWMVHSYARYSFAAVSCVVENAGIRASLKRSRALAKGALRRVWMMFFFALCIFLPISTIVNVPGAVAQQWVRHHRSVFMAWGFAGEFVAMLISVPVVVIGATLIYYDQRVRREALDVETLIAAAEAANAAHAAVHLPVVDEPAVAAIEENAQAVTDEKSDDPPEAMPASSGS